MSSSLSKIHVTNSTGLSLNDRFTAISSQPKVVTSIGTGRRSRSRSRSRSVQRQIPAVMPSDRNSSRANQRLLAQLQRKHKVQAALKLKRRSMRTVGGGTYGNGNGSNVRISRGSVKAFRVGANGKPIRANSLARVATMKADKESLRRPPLRRYNSSANLANRLGPRRPVVGGAAQRVAKRNLDRQRRRNSGVGLNSGRNRSVASNNRGRSRSRSRTRTQSGTLRNRSRSRNTNGNPNNNRSRSRNRYRTDTANGSNTTNNPRGRSRSRSRGRVGIINKSNLPIKARLGVRPNATATRGLNNRRRNASVTRRGVQTGRVQKKRNSTAVTAAGTSDNNNRMRNRSRSATRNARNDTVRSRSRSRTRKGQVGQQQQRQQGQRNGRAPRGRSLQRRGSNNNNGKRGRNNNGNAHVQQRRGRSRSRTGRGSNGAGSRNQGNKTNTASKPAVNKDDLDKELDQYMATTKTENEMDYLLKN